MSFAEVTRIEDRGEGRFGASFDASWGQGRALYGGIQAAVLVRALRESGIPDDRRLRTLAVHFCRAAAPGDLEIEARIVRSGGYVTQGSGHLLQQGEVVATALATFARTRGDAERFDDFEAPDLPPPEALSRTPSHPTLPAFLGNVDLRFTPESIPFQGNGRREVAGWCRFLDPGDLDEVFLAGLLDIWPPSILPALPEPRPSASVDLRYDVLGAEPLAGAGGDDFFAFRARALHGEAGYVVDESELWTRDGRPVARVRQLRVVF